jgi:hypothetical protein
MNEALMLCDSLLFCNRVHLRQLAAGLKLMNTEHQAVGEMLERGCDLLDGYRIGISGTDDERDAAWLERARGG